MRKEATNTFTKGMVSDFGPLTTPNDVLTHALNATIITMNGNEYILQNDMGNGRVESAYLPSGYVPLGVKEYGGVIYVVSYNPLTGKGQVGSFPSPERNITSEEIGDEPPEFTLDDFKDNKTTTLKKALFNEDVVIRPGDKFLIYINNQGNTDNNYITSFNNTNGEQIKYIKKSRITFKVCVLDKNNNLFDVTDSLKRFETTGDHNLITKGTTPTNVYVNRGYYAIPGGILKSGDNPDLKTYRQQILQGVNANIYNNKLIGQLYIVGELNTLSTFSVGIDGEEVSDGNYNLYFETDWQYNCPDGFKGTEKPNIDIQTYGQAIEGSAIIGASIIFNNDTSNKKHIDFNINPTFNLNQELQINTALREYNAENNLYDQRQLNVISYSGKGKISYEITPEDADLRELSGLTIRGTINLDKLGSGQISITTWKYFRNDNYLLLNWGLDAYPRRNEKLSNLTLQFVEFYNYSDTNSFNNPDYTYNVSNKRNYNGIFSEPLHLPEWKEVNDTPRNRLFICRILISSTSSVPLKDSNNNNIESITINGIKYYILGYRFVFNTDLYNEAYFKVTAQDWGDEETNKATNNTSETNLSYYRVLQLNNNSTITLQNRDNVIPTDVQQVKYRETNGKQEWYNPTTPVITTNDNNPVYQQIINTQNYTVSLDTSNREYSNKEYYPFYMTLRNINETLDIDSFTVSGDIKFNKEAKEIVTQSNVNDKQNFDILDKNINGTNASFTLKGVDRFKAAGFKDEQKRAKKALNIIYNNSYLTPDIVASPIVYCKGRKHGDFHRAKLGFIKYLSSSNPESGSENILNSAKSIREDEDDARYTYGYNNGIKYWPDAMKDIFQQMGAHSIIFVGGDSTYHLGGDEVAISNSMHLKDDGGNVGRRAYVTFFWKTSNSSLAMFKYYWPASQNLSGSTTVRELAGDAQVYLASELGKLYQLDTSSTDAQVKVKVPNESFYNKSNKITFNINFKDKLTQINTIDPNYENKRNSIVVLNNNKNDLYKEAIKFQEIKQNYEAIYPYSATLTTEGFDDYVAVSNLDSIDIAYKKSDGNWDQVQDKDTIFQSNYLYKRDDNGKFTQLGLSQFQFLDGSVVINSNKLSSTSSNAQLEINIYGDRAEHSETTITFESIPAFSISDNAPTGATLI